jgi:N-acetylmuramoyl-L-alanine amidase
LHKIIRFLLITLLISSSCFAISNKYYQDKFNITKKLYLGAIMSNNKLKEIEYLKRIIRYGNKLKINTKKYKRELSRIDKNVVLRSPIVTKSILKPRYTIKSVTQKNNIITINFYNNINTKYIKFTKHRLKYGYIFDFNIKGNFKDASPTKLSVFGVDKIKIYQQQKDILKISLKNRKNLKCIYSINKKQINIKITKDKTKNKTKIIKKVKILPSDILYPSRKIIVIDAGHGGRDSGAVGKRKNYEKTVVLNISRYLKKELQKFGFTIYLTRSKDKYVKLSYRTKYANRKNADFFISIHANAARKARAKKAYGVETYFLSPARSARAKRVAALENKGDMKKMGWSSKNSLLTILNQSKITASNKMAIDIQRNILYLLRGKYGKSAIRDGGVREGPFWVLVGAQMPSVLIEVGYISHPIEGRRISTKNYQKRIAKGIAKGIKSYFIKN